MESNRIIQCIVVDDEHPAVRLLSSYIKETPGLQLALQTTSALEALEAINKGSADLVLLNIQMPQMTDIELMKSVKNHQTKVIFTTAYTEYALEGYQYDVIDYLLKPITFERFLVAIAKTRQRIGSVPAQQCSGYLLLKTEYKIHKTDFSDILYIEGLGDYLIFYLSTGKLMTLERMKNMEQILPDECFIRTHKSYIVNINKIDYFEKGKIVVGRQYLPVGDTYKNTVKLKLGL
jgi:two-component system LytT family response regulator